MSWRKNEQIKGILFILPSVLGIFLLFVIPTLITVIFSFTDYQFSSDNIHFAGFSNFIKLFHSELFYKSLIHTGIFLASVPISIAIAFLVAMALNRSVYFKKTLRAMYFLPYITSIVAIAFVWMLLFDPSQGPINQFLMAIGIENPPAWLAGSNTAMIAIDIIWIWYMLGFNMILYLAALQEVPSELLEAAKIDGAGYWKSIRHVILPLISPTTFLLLIMGFVSTIKNFGMVHAITEGGPGESTTVLAFLVYKNAFGYYEIGYASAMSLALFAIILIITFIQWYGQKKWVHY